MSRTYSASVDPFFASRQSKLLSTAPLVAARASIGVVPRFTTKVFHVSIGISCHEIDYTVTLLPPSSGQLLLCLLNLMASFCVRSEIQQDDCTPTCYKLSADHSPPIKAGEDSIEETSSRQLSRDVLIFLIEDQDSFLVGTA